jgi:type I restriction enzyme M protein
MKNLAQVIGFQTKENAKDIYIKKYSSGYSIEIDFDKKTFHFGGKIKIQGKDFQNITKPEDWVVLECVNRLLEKGYKPENISLEKVYPAGHGFSGRLDICVTREDGSEYLLIECKTQGKEFEKEFARMKKDGGQLFTYFKFSNKSDVIMLYTSELKGKEIVSRNEIVKIEEDYRTGDVKDFYEKWNKLTKDNGVFDNWVNPYSFISKALTPNLLQPIKQEDSNFIFIRFLEILRNNVVSDEGNAFNKIFTLFLCKVYDEKSTKENEELKFQWFEGKDDDVSFQLRLTDLYKNGMLEFLEKEVSDFSEDAFEDKFKHLKPEDKKDLLFEIHKLRLEKNNEFAIKEVFDHQSFKENAKVVKQVVELLQGYRIRYNKRQQYLSDFFELLLTTGLKQKVGQYFTPVPVAQFVIKSLPIDVIVNEKLEKGERNNLLPFIIDYAAGSGHFLTESMHEIQRHLDSKKPNDFISDTAKKIKTWQDDHFDWATRYVYGIEKDYRLVKVGKVGCYLHGDGLANVILSDGLANFSKTKEYKGLLKKTDVDFPKENKQFDIVLSNPPYSVPAFKLNSREFYNENDFELYNSLSDQSPQIEVLFIERTKQLLKNGGLAGIILPNTILSGKGNYTKAREIILQYFDIVAIAEFGSNTFMATGTNTVTLFLRRRNNYDSIGWKNSVNAFFESQNEVTINGIEKPVTKYINLVWETISLEDFITLLNKEPNKVIKEHEIYKEYQKKIKAKNENEFWSILLERENEKLYYFIITFKQKTVLVKTGEKNNEKRFLGYDFSDRRGSQGIHAIQQGKNIEDCTSLFDPIIFDNPTKASTYIYKAFNGDFDSEIEATLQNNVSRHDLVNMLTFNRVEFEKDISLSVKKKVEIESKWEMKSLTNLFQIKTGKKDANYSTPEGDYPFFTCGETTLKAPSYSFDTEAILVAGNGNVGQCKYYNGKFEAYQRTYVFDNFINEILPLFAFYLLKDFLPKKALENIQGSTMPYITLKTLESIQIPLPPLNIQQKIVSEIEVLETKEKNTKIESDILKSSIYLKYKNLSSSKQRLDVISTFKNGLNFTRKSSGETIEIVGVKDFQDNFSPNLHLLEKIQIDGELSDEYKLKKGDLLVVRSNGSANLVGRFLMIEKINNITSYSGFTIRIRPNFEKTDSKFLCYYLKSDIVRNELSENSVGSNIKSLNQTQLSNIKIPLPPLSEQQKIVSEIEKIEAKIKVLETEIAEIPKLKEAVLKKYL